MPKNQTAKPSRVEGTGVDRLYKRTGVRKVSFFYQYPDGKRETFTTAPVGDRQAISDAERKAKRQALDIQQGAVVAGSVAQMIERFRDDEAPRHYADQSKDGLAVRAGAYANLIKFFGKMLPASLRTVHGYQYIDDRAKQGAPAKGVKELSQMSTICHYGVRWGVIESNPFTDMMHNKRDKVVRTISRSQIVRFYLWALRQPAGVRVFGCAAMFTYLTGFRAAEVRPFHINGLTRDGVAVMSVKRKKGEDPVSKLREWSTRLSVVVARAKQTHTVQRLYLFANSRGRPYTKSGWGSQWADVMQQWIGSFDPAVAQTLAAKRKWEARYTAAYRLCKKIEPFDGPSIADHPAYFALTDIRPAAITTKLRNRDADAYDFAAHANPATTHRHYDRRTEKKAKATE